MATCARHILEEIPVMQLAETLLAEIQKQAESLSIDLITELAITLNASLLAITRIHNTLSPINNLPPDVLGLIFQLVPDAPYTRAAYYYGKAFMHPPWSPSCVNPAPYVKLSHVCRLWRHLALDLPSLWANIVQSPFVAGAVPTDVLLRRSRSAPLNVYWTGYPGEALTALFSSQDAQRIRSIWWEGNEAILYPEDLGFPAPSIESLTLLGVDRISHKRVRMAPIFDAQALRIRYLSLRGMLWLPANDMHSLTQLQLASYESPGLSSDILSVLERTPNLVDLVLSRNRDTSVQFDSRLVSLPKLRRIVFQHRLDDIGIAAVLTHLEVPDSTALRLRYFMPYKVENLIKLSRSPVVRTATKVFITQDSNVCEVVAVGPASGVDIITELCDRDDTVGFAPLFAMLYAELPLLQIRELWIVEREGAFLPLSGQYNRFVPMLRQMRNLEKLLVMEENLHRIIDALLAPTDSSRLPLFRRNMTKSALCALS
ncbi:hypothetical protein BKA93DRAFT_150803 [Sparassis latifolia]